VGARRHERGPDQAEGDRRGPLHPAQERHPEAGRRLDHDRRSALGHARGLGLMPSFYYRARDMNGRPHEGIEVANTEEEVLRMLESAALVPVFIESRAPEASAAPLAGELSRQWRQFAAAFRPRVKPAAVALFA